MQNKILVTVIALSILLFSVTGKVVFADTYPLEGQPRQGWNWICFEYTYSGKTYKLLYSSPWQMKATLSNSNKTISIDFPAPPDGKSYVPTMQYHNGTSWDTERGVVLVTTGASTGGTYDSIKIISSTFNVIDGNGNIVYKPIIPENVTIISPSIGYKDTVDGITSLISYKMAQNTPADKISIKVHSETIPDANWVIQQHDYNATTGEGLLQVFATPVPVGTHTIEVTVAGVKKTREFTRYSGVVDENGDGIDDRTGQPIGDGHSQEPIDDKSFIESSITTMKSFAENFKGFETFIKSFIGIFPTWITLPIATLFSVLVIMTIVKIIRG